MQPRQHFDLGSASPKPCRSKLALVACFLLVAQLFSLAHLLIVPHTRCAEHGETIHGDGHEAVEQPKQLRAAAPLVDGQAALDSSPGEITDEHDEHCQVLTDRYANGLRFALLESAPVALPVAIEDPVVVRAVVARAIYRLAPKVSPPVAHA